jgi:hypothetical protein
VVVALGLAASPAAWADRPDSINKLIQAGKLENAQSKCDRWAAHSAETEAPLREACAAALWPLAEAADTERDWANYRTRWVDTSWATKAKAREAAAVARDMPDTLGEDELIALADRYAETPTGPAFRMAAGRAAFRDAASEDEARAVAERWEGHPELGRLVERFPAVFVRARLGPDGTAQLKIEPEIPLAGELAPKVSWIAAEPGGDSELWDIAVKTQLAEWGVPASVASALPQGTAEPALPVCFMPNMPPGWTPAIEIRVGAGRGVQPIGFDDGCGPDSWPTFLALDDNKVTGVSLRPGHHVRFAGTKDAFERRIIGAWLPAPSGTPQLHDGTVTVQAGGGWLVWPISGGMPWATGRPPAAEALPLTASLRGAGLPSGWTVTREDGMMAVESARLTTMPEPYRDWGVKGNEVRFVAPFIAATFGLGPKNVTPPSPAAPQLGPQAGWAYAPDGSVLRQPPAGATVAGIYKLDEASIEGALGVVAGIGISRDRIQILDGWKADLDDDKIQERVLRVLIDKVPSLIIVDPIDGEEAYTADMARVFVMEEPAVQINGRAAQLPFTFRKGSFVYMAWGGVEVLGARSRRPILAAIRFDGTGFVSERWTVEQAE